MVKHRIGGLPVVEQGKVVGIITAQSCCARLPRSWALPRKESHVSICRSGTSSELAMVAQLVAQENGEILGMGVYQDEGKKAAAR